MYDTLVRVLSKVKEPAKFAELDDALTVLLGDSVPEYLPRSVIRFWVARNLIDHSGARFAAKRPGAGFRSEAKEAWNRVANAPMKVESRSE